MVPTRLFDTELAGRLAGFPRVGLGAMVESVLGFVLEKGHSAVDWSTRPLRSRGCATPRSTWNCSSICATPWRRSSTGRAGTGLGSTGVRRDRAGRARAAAQGPLAPHVRDAQGAPPSADGGRAGAVGGPGPDRPAPGHLAGQGAGGAGHRGGRARPSGQRARACRAERVRAPDGAARAGGGRPPWTARRRCRTPSWPPGQPVTGPPPPRASATRTGRAARKLFRRGPPCRRWPELDSPAGEPDHSGHGPAGVLGAAGRCRRRVGFGRARRVRGSCMARGSWSRRSWWMRWPSRVPSRRTWCRTWF